MLLPFLFSALIVAADQAVKWWIVSSLQPEEVRTLIPGVLSLTRIRNTGAAFSLLRDHTWLLAVISAIFAVLVVVLLVKRYFTHPLAVWSLAAVLGGAVGNLIDRIRLGYVVDMFLPEFIDFAVFNVADIFITCGGILFCVWLLLSYSQSRRNSASAATEPPEDKHDGTD